MLTFGLDIFHLAQKQALIKTGSEKYVCHIPQLEETLVVEYRMIDGDKSFVIYKRNHRSNVVYLAKQYQEWVTIEKLHSQEYTYSSLQEVQDIINRYLMEMF